MSSRRSFFRPMFATLMAVYADRRLSGAPLTQARPVQHERDVRDVLASEGRRFDALLKADVATLRLIMRADCSYTHSTGTVQGRDEYLAPIAARTTRYVDASGADLRVRVIGDAAVVNGRATLNAMVAGDPALRRNDLRYTNVWIRSDGIWQLAAWHATRMPAPAEA